MISRRDFIKTTFCSLAALGLPAPLKKFNFINGEELYPSISWTLLPARIQKILLSVPDLSFDSAGFLWFVSSNRTNMRLPVRRTQWNIEHSAAVDKLLPQYAWQIVLHWFGDSGDHNDNIDFFFYGFDQKKRVAEGKNYTSAHFLVGTKRIDPKEKGLSILQTQTPDNSGNPFVCSHLYYKDAENLPDDNYFLNAVKELSFEDKSIYFGLQDIYSHKDLDPNYTTIAIEISGSDFDNPDYDQNGQQIANVVGLLWALMRKYNISAQKILGHEEIDQRKTDPGKLFIALIRYLIGIKALLDENAEMFNLVFRDFLERSPDVDSAVKSYFDFYHGLLSYVARPDQVFRWESDTKFGVVQQTLHGEKEFNTDKFILPVYPRFYPRADGFLLPVNHEGLDIYTTTTSSDYKQVWPVEVNLVSDGECVFVGRGSGCSWGKAAVFRHRQSDGAEFVSIYGHLNETSIFNIGKTYLIGTPVGMVCGSGKADDSYLHFALAYYATWKMDLRNHVYISPNVSQAWIKSRFFSPNEYFVRRGAVIPQSGMKH